MSTRLWNNLPGSERRYMFRGVNTQWCKGFSNTVGSNPQLEQPLSPGFSQSFGFTIQDEFILETYLSSFSFLLLFVTTCSFLMFFFMRTTIWWCGKLFWTLFLSLKQHSMTLSLVNSFRMIFQVWVKYNRVWECTLSVWSYKARSGDCGIIAYGYAL